MKKELYKVNYELKNGSIGVLWKLISTSAGLSEWFAEDVKQDGNIYSFKWGKTTQKARVISIAPNSFIRFRWEDEPEEFYFELRIDYSDLTGGNFLIITDFAEPTEKKGSIELWNAQVETLTRRSGM
jgi:uncharacterized protein YndB with AHSA1/START domain